MPALTRPRPRPRRRRWTTVLAGGTVAGAALLGGGVALADGGSSTPSAPADPSTGNGTPPAPPVDGTRPAPPEGGTPPAPPVPPAGPEQAGDRLVGTVTDVSDASLTLTDDTGDSHTVSLTDDTRTGGPVAPGTEESADAEPELAVGERVEVHVRDGAPSRPGRSSRTSTGWSSPSTARTSPS